MYGATYHEAKQTLNLVPERVFGVDMVRYVERWLLEAAGSEPAAVPADRAVERGSRAFRELSARLVAP